MARGGTTRRWGRFVQADTIVPKPENPQDLNRYSYTRNNPLRYTDPTGHDLKDGWDCVQGMVAQVLLNNSSLIPTAREALAAKPGESSAMTMGRSVGDAWSMLQGAIEITAGLGGEAASILVSATGVGSIVGVPAMAINGVVAAHGASVLLSAATEAGKRLGNQMAARSSKGTNPDLLGANGPRLDGSKTIWQKGQQRVDVENFAPGERPASIHLHTSNTGKWQYRPDLGQFAYDKSDVLAPSWVQKLLERRDIRNALDKARKYLGE